MKKKIMNFWNHKLPVERRVKDVVSAMTLDEKVSQMIHPAKAIERLGIPQYNWWNECLHGVARAGRATVFPQAIGMAASFDTDLMYKVATAISDEARAKHHQAVKQGNRTIYCGLTYWSPNINIFRDPRWGRGQETYGECPYLTARMGVAFVKGLQGNHPKYLKLVATPKHYAVHSGPEPIRHHFNAVVSQRDLRETYLPAFEACVREAGAFSVMGAYNRTLDEPCCASKLLLGKILRGEWGFKGYVVSDCGAICDFHNNHKITNTPQESAALAVRNGCDLNCGETYPSLINAVKEGLISEAEIEIAVGRLFDARIRLGMFDPPKNVPYTKIPPNIVNCEKHRKLARQMARESIVLLKNEKNLLPLKKDLKCILVAGPIKEDIRPLQGNYYGYSPNMVTLMQGLVGAVSPGTKVTFIKGCDLTGDRPIDEGGIKWNIDDADVIIATLGLSPEMEGEEGDAAASEAQGDRIRIGLPRRQEELLKRLHATGKPVVLVLTGGSPIEIKWAAENIPAIIMAWYPGEEGGNAVADVIFGDYNPAGRLPITFYESLEQVPPFENYNMKGRTYRFMTDEPTYRFGYGLSYTTFAYSNLKLSKKRISKDESVTVSVDVKNTGKRAGDEVVQLYVSDIEASVPVPLIHLEGFKRIHLRTRQKKTVKFDLTPRQLSAFDNEGKPFVEPGKFKISAGGGQPDTRLKNWISGILTVK
mgnify:CR=1 FL=1